MVINGTQKGIGEVSSLEDRHTSHVNVAGPMRLCVEDGVAYVTLEGDFRDYILHGGQALELENPGMAVIQGLPNTSFRVCQLKPQRAA